MTSYTNVNALENVRIIAYGIGAVTRPGYEWINMAGRATMLENAILQLAADHPDTPVSWPQDGITHYQTIADWAAYVLSGDKP